MAETPHHIYQQLINLSQDLGREDLDLAILGEGNTSARYDDDSFLVKASGSNLRSLSEADLTRCSFERILALFKNESMDDSAVDQYLLDSRMESDMRKPSVETLFHAYLLSLPGIDFVGHTHSIAVNQILCSPRAAEFAEHRLFPDEIVCCGTASVFVDYTDPGMVLARAIRDSVEAFIQKHSAPPRVILLKNHGIITCGSSPNAVLAAMRMADKAARIFVGAATLGGPVFLTPENVLRIAGRPDEKYRQEALKL